MGPETHFPPRGVCCQIHANTGKVGRPVAIKDIKLTVVYCSYLMGMDF